VVGFQDNGAATTAVIGARYDNSSGLAGMIELARLLAASTLRSNNYLFIVFSGSGPGWKGSEYFAAHPVIDLKKVNYLLEVDRLGALNDATHVLNIGGYATSTTWAAIGNSIRDKRSLSFHYDSSTAQPGDHAAFYREKIPLLVFTTGPGSDDDLRDQVNYPGEMQVLKFIYALIEGANTKGRLMFTP
jgi:aminopeptidase YwaD